MSAATAETVEKESPGVPDKFGDSGFGKQMNAMERAAFQEMNPKAQLAPVQPKASAPARPATPAPTPEEDEEIGAPNVGARRAPDEEVETTAETPEAENEAEAEPDGEADPEAEPAETDEEPDATLKADWPESAKKRVGQLTAARKAAEGKVSQAEARVTALTEQLEGALKGAPVKLQTNALLGDVWNHDDLAQRQADALAWADFCTYNRDGGELTGPDGQRREYTAADIQTRLKEARAVQAGVIRRAEFVTQFQASTARAQEKYPYLADKGSPEFKEAQAIIREAPGLLTSPKLWELLGQFIEGKKALTARGRGKPGATPAAASRPNPAQPARQKPTAPRLPSGEGASRGPAKGKSLKEAKTQDDLEEVMLGTVKGARAIWGGEN
jgi:hypothetical protein